MSKLTKLLLLLLTWITLALSIYSACAEDYFIAYQSFLLACFTSLVTMGKYNYLIYPHMTIEKFLHSIDNKEFISINYKGVETAFNN